MQPVLKFFIPVDLSKCNIFRTYLAFWEARGIVKTFLYDGDFVWMEGIGQFLFWPWPKIYHVIDGRLIDSRNIECRVKIYANEIPNPPRDDYATAVVPSFFWARQPGRVEQANREMLNFDQRDVRSVFLGKLHNPEQSKFRQGDFSRVIEVYHISKKDEPYPFTSEEYLDIMSRSRFALSMRGYGPKCNREIEALAVGSLLLADQRVDTGGYWEPLEEGKHFLRITGTEDVKRVQRETTREEWERITEAGQRWYRNNCSFVGAHRVLNEIRQVHG